MDIDKSLYMKEFLEMRSSLGCVFNREARSVLHTNLYDEFLPRKVKTEVVEVVEEIEEKTIQILNKGQLEANKNTKREQDKTADKTEDAPVLFEDAMTDVEDEGVSENVSENVSQDVEDESSTKQDKVVVIEEDTTDDTDKKDTDKSMGGLPPVPNIDLLGGGHQLKKIVINPNYVAADS